ncbi:MAG: acetyl-CoA synthetase [Halobacteriota archaeon]
METVPEVLDRDRRNSTAAVECPTLDRVMSYHDFITTAYKSGNVLRYLGVGPGAVVAIDPRLTPEALLAFFGAAQLGAIATFDPTASDARVVLVPVDRESELDPGPQTRLAVYGGVPKSPQTTHWEASVWSENPAFPSTTISPDAAVLRRRDRELTHRQVGAAAESIVETYALGSGDAVVFESALTDPRTVAAGVLAPLSIGATAVCGRTADVDDDVELRIVPSGTAVTADRVISIDDVPL